MSIDILPIADGHIEGYHAAPYVVARERPLLFDAEPKVSDPAGLTP